MTILFSYSSPKIIQVRHFWSQIYGFLFLDQTLQQEKFEVTNFKCDKSFFKFQSKNTQSSTFCPKLRDFYFCTKLWNNTNSMTQISNMTILIPNSSKKYSNKKFSLKTQKFFLF